MSEKNISEELLLPDAQDTREQDIFNSLIDAHRDLAVAVNDIGSTYKVKATSTDPTEDYLDGKVDNSTIEVASNKLQIKAGGITSDELTSGLAGAGLAFDSGALKVNVASPIEIVSDTLGIATDGINETHIELTNNAYIQGANTLGTGIDILKINTSNYIQFGNTIQLPNGIAVDEISGDTTMADASNLALVTEYAVKNYTDTQVAGINQSFGSWESKSEGTIYQASSDGFIVVFASIDSTAANTDYLDIKTDSSNPPTTVRQRYSRTAYAGTSTEYIGLMSPVKSGDYYKVEDSGNKYNSNCYFIGYS